MILENEFMTDPRVRREAEYLASEGYRLSVLTPDFNSSALEEKNKNIEIIRFRLRKFIFNKFRPLTPSISVYTHIWSKQLIRYLEAYKIDILHVHDLPLMKLGIEIGKKYKVPVVGDFHENYSEAIKMYYWANTLKGKLLINFKKWENLQRYCVKNLTKIVVVADEAVAMFSEKYDRSKNDFFIVDNSIDIDQFTKSGINKTLNDKLHSIYAGKIVFGYVGAILPNRGLYHFFKILPKFKDTNIKIVIVGNGQQKKDLIAFLKSYRLEHLVDWYDWQPFENIMTFIQNFNVGITRLERNLQNDATTPNKVFQYMYMKKPVLTADSLPMRRIVKETESGLVFESNNSRDLINRIEQLLADKNLRKQLGENGRKNVMARYNWKVTRTQLVKLYREMGKKYYNL